MPADGACCGLAVFSCRCSVVTGAARWATDDRLLRQRCLGKLRSHGRSDRCRSRVNVSGRGPVGLGRRTWSHAWRPGSCGCFTGRKVVRLADRLARHVRAGWFGLHRSAGRSDAGVQPRTRSTVSGGGTAVRIGAGGDPGWGVGGGPSGRPGRSGTRPARGSTSESGSIASCPFGRAGDRVRGGTRRLSRG